MHAVLAELRHKTGLQLSNIEYAEARSAKLLKSARRALKGLDLPRTSSVVTLGSLARGEATEGSDLDWFVLHDGLASQEPSRVLPEITRRLDALGLPPPSPIGPFAQIANASELVRHIGLQEDTNKNVTQRVVLLLESRAIANESAHRGVQNCVLERYLEDTILRPKGSGRFVPQFLLNDVVRYWRTICVDYQAKKRLNERKWALRNIKLRISRKMLFASSLATLIECRCEDDVLAFLTSRMAEPPLVQLGMFLLAYDNMEAATKIFQVYDEFLRLIGTEEMRRHLEELPFAEFDTDPRFSLLREMSHRLQGGLELAFFDGPADVAAAIKRFGVF